MPSVSKKLTGILRSHTLKVLILLPACGLLSWIFTDWVFAGWTDHGTIYARVLTPSSATADSSVVVIRLNEEYFARYFDAETQVAEIDVFMSGRIALTLRVGPAASLAEDTWGVCEENETRYSLSWRLSGSATHGARRLYGDEAVTGCTMLVGFSEAPAWAKHARDVEIQVPRGGLEPLIALLLRQAGQGNGETPDAETLSLVSKRLATEVASRLEYERLEWDLGRISFLYGPVQFLTVMMTIFCFLTLMLSLKLRWSRNVAENAMNLIPYIGFFGTLLGMGAALAILGQANLSDPVSKAINLGPIGSKLALAIETTKLALVCFGLTTLISMMRDAFCRNLGAANNQSEAAP